MKRNFVYSTAGLSAVNASHSPPLKKYKSFGENKDLIDDDDLLIDAIGTQALEQFESNQSASPDKTDGRCASVTTSSFPKVPSSSNVSSSSANSHQPRIIPYRQGSNETTECLQLEALQQIKLLEQKIKLLQDEKYSQVGEVKILREKLNQVEANTHTKEVALQQINDQSRLKLAEKEMEWAEKEKKFEEHIASLSSRLKFKEQETSAAAYEKCKCSDHQDKIAQKEFPPPTKEMRVQTDIKVTPVSARCRDTKNSHRTFKSFGTDFPTSDPLKALSQQDGCCNKGKLKTRVPQQRCNKTVNSTSTPMHSTPVVDQETQTPVDVLRHGRIEDGITCMELSDPSMSMNGRKLFNHLISIHPWLSQSCKDGTNGGLLISTRDKDYCMSMEDDKGEEDRINYFISLELPTSASSTPFLRNPAVQYDLRQSLANMLGSPHLPPVYPEQNLLPDLDTVGIARGDSGITLLLVLEKLVRKYSLERTKGQDGHCRSVESWVSGSLEGLLPPFASLSDEDRVGHTSRDPMRMDNVQAIVCIMEVLLDLVCHSKLVRCHILDNYLGIPSRPPLSLDSHCVSSDRKWGDVSSNGRITPCVMEQADDGQVTMECDNGMIKTETPGISFSCLKHLAVPLAGKLSAPRRTHYMTDMTVSMSKKVLTEASLDTSILSSVVGSYDDHDLSGSASFIQQSSNNHSDSSLHASNLFNTLLRLMEPSYKFYEEEAAVISNALEILVVLAQDCSEHQMECYLEPTLGTILRSILRRGRFRMCVMVIDLLYHLASSQAVISNLCNNNDDCPLLQAYEQLTNPPKPFTDTDTEYGLKVLQMVARSVCTGKNKEGGKPMFIFDFDCCCSSELISGLLAFTKRMIKNYMTDRRASSNISYEVISQLTLVLLPVIVNQDIGDDITHSDAYKHDYTEVVKGLSTVLLQSASSSGKWEQAVTALKELLDYDDLQDCLNATCNSVTTIKNMDTE